MSDERNQPTQPVSESPGNSGVGDVLRALTTTDALQAANAAHERTEIGGNKMLAALQAAADVAREAVSHA